MTVILKIQPKMPLFLICKSLAIIFLSQTIMILPLSIRILPLTIVIIPQRRKRGELKKARSSKTFLQIFLISKNSYKPFRHNKLCSAERTRYALTPSLSFRARGVYLRRHEKKLRVRAIQKKRKKLEAQLTKKLAAAAARQVSRITRLMHKYQAEKCYL